MNKLIRLSTFAIVAVLAAACAKGNAATNAPAATSSPSAQNPNGASGEVVKVAGSSLVLSNQQGDTDVTYTSQTRITKTRTATLADITPGMCIRASGSKDGTGKVSAASVRLSNRVNGSCVLPTSPGGRPAGASAPSGSPPPQAQNASMTNGEVVSVSGTSVTVRDAKGASQTVDVPTTSQVSESLAAAPSDITIGECAFAAGQRTSGGAVAATALTLSPPGPNGCTARGTGGGFGSRGGRGAGGAPPAA